MQYRPDSKELLQAIQDFLMKDLLPKLEGDDLLSYKTLVSWNMLGVIAREIENSDFTSTWSEILDSNLSISDLETNYPMDSFYKLSKKEKNKVLREWNQNLASLIRKKSSLFGTQQSEPIQNKTELDIKPRSKVWNLVKSQLKENLAVSNPRFQT
ncbi:hypothetical protein LEP1GSC202_0980 [Leptospira yanagawae serovar Saopaulo str. Sao Paulo = ATCC 700523]|uniref:Uncharacterized protein n=1 Tax=Leptospira yanagawae serovar Saopaulo str. Sao Paulo = ATCC 700523 TaxID=1249483 RepID=A0A5E8HFL3_9LEPT|nr:hypothetical protein [Leptospira yanagawae]EOQ90039.1 hypothetical protein LEP1GSC202_0980 [Leptospira yanagawae serovar Saopaulo str. Sao Paulo = ATCC 700523]